MPKEYALFDASRALEFFCCCCLHLGWGHLSCQMPPVGTKKGQMPHPQSALQLFLHNLTVE